MQILRSGVRVNVNIEQSQIDKPFIEFVFDVPIHTGELLLHNLGTLTPVVLAKDIDGNVVTNISVTPVSDNDSYSPEQLSRVGFTSGSSFTGTLRLTKD